MENGSFVFEPVYNVETQGKIDEEFPLIEGRHYLDHAGATLYSTTQLQNVFSDFISNVYVNPHSGNHFAKITEDAIDIIRYQILQHFNTNPEEYSLIFTSNATQSLKIIGEYFHYGDQNQGTLAYLETNHTSVLGMRNYSKNIQVIRTSEAFEVLSEASIESNQNLEEESNNCFIYPAQCNYSGTKFPLKWIEKVKKGALNKIIESNSKNWYILLDAASFVSTNKLDLAKFKPDFVPISFYKLFGYPTGIGALLVRKGSEKVLLKKYYGGGTVLMALTSRNIMVPRPLLYDKFEDGTLPFLSILSLRHGLDTLKRLNLDMEIISKHTFSLAQYVFRNLTTLHHSNGKPVAVLYHDSQFEDRDVQGGIVNFNLLRADGQYVGYAEVLHMANLYGIVLRTGCCCNPGACQRFLGLNDEDVIKHFKAGHVCGDENDLVDGYPTGSIRISFGYMSRENDAQKFLEMIENCFVSTPVLRKIPQHVEYTQNYFKLHQYAKINAKSKLNNHQGPTSRSKKEVTSENSQLPEGFNLKGMLTGILLYPIKSCGAFAVTQWPITSKGLKFDREWMIVNSQGTAFTQKNNKKLCLIKPRIDLEKQVLQIEFKDHSDVETPLDIASKTQTAYLCQSKVCKDRVEGWDCGDEIAEWLSNCLEAPGLRLLRQHTDQEKESEDRQLSFNNKAQFLLVSSKSVEWLRHKIPKGAIEEDLNATINRFRPNFIVNFPEPFEENNIQEFVINKIHFKNDGKCTRCQMICVDQQSGEVTKEPLLTLSKELMGKIFFGVYLKHTNVKGICTIASRSKVYTK